MVFYCPNWCNAQSKLLDSYGIFLTVDIQHFMKKLIKGSVMKKKLLVLLIALASTMMPNIASAIAIDVGDWICPSCCDFHRTPCWLTSVSNFWLVVDGCTSSWGLKGLWYEKETTSTIDSCYSHIDAKLSICDCDWWGLGCRSVP